MRQSFVIILIALLAVQDGYSENAADTSIGFIPNGDADNRDTITAPLWPLSLYSSLNAVVYLKSLGNNFSYQANIPLHLKHLWHRKPPAILLAGAIALLKTDRSINHDFNELKQNYFAVRKTSPALTTLGAYRGLMLVGILGMYGMANHNRKLTTTAVLSSQACITSGVWAMLLKQLTGRTRPAEYNHWTGPGGLFERRKGIKGNFECNSFPSGHTTTAFAIATVFARQYHDTPVIPIAAYTLATLTGLSRMTENRHWASDVVVGGMLGYLCGFEVVENYKRLAGGITPEAKHRRMRHIYFSPVITGYSTGILVHYQF